MTKRAGAKAKPEPAAPVEQAPIKKKSKTLVVYATKGGATGGAADLIAKTLQEEYSLEVDEVNLRQQPKPDIAKYDNIVVGGGVRANKIYSETVDFMKQDFSGKRVAIFICSGAGGDPRHREEVVEKYITKQLGANIDLVAKEAFGGCMKILGKSVFDSRDPAKVKAWAEEVGKKFID